VTTQQTIPWPRFLTEGVVIVASILLAFWIDAWWDGRKDKLEEKEILIGLEIEFVDLAERLDRWTEYNRTGVELIGEYLSDAVSGMDLNDIQRTFFYARIVNVLDQGGAIDALLASGRLEKITDREIRARLLMWPDWLEDIHTNDLSARSFSTQEIQRFLIGNGHPQTTCPSENYSDCSDPEELLVSLRQLAQDLEFRAMLMVRRGWMQAIANDHENAGEEARGILELIRATLGEME
jgi:hypothetical protein